jgi:hypothetical protein
MDIAKRRPAITRSPRGHAGRPFQQNSEGSQAQDRDRGVIAFALFQAEFAGRKAADSWKAQAMARITIAAAMTPRATRA